MAFNFFKKNKKSENNSGSTSNSRYLQLKIKEVKQESKDAVSIAFENPDEGLSYQSGQYLTLLLSVNGEDLRRAYSLCSSPFTEESPRIAVKRVEDGKVSNFINDELKEGQEIKVMEAMGNFTLEPEQNKSRQLVLIAGGSGITPIYSILKSILKVESSSKVALIYANRDPESIIFKEELDHLMQAHSDRFKLIHCLDGRSAEIKGAHGQIDKASLKEHLGTLALQNPNDATYYVCGPGGLMDLVFEGLDEFGIQKDRIKKESFVVGQTSPKDLLDPVEKKGKDKNSYTVKIILDGEEHEVKVPANKSILEAALDKGLDMPYSCQSGLCTSCRGKKLAGEMHMEEDEGLTEEELAEGYVLNCVGHPKGEGLVIEIG